MIPKIIHFCWLSNDPYPAKIQKCIDSWSRVMPEYEIWLWNFDRLGDAATRWVHEAFDNKKYAFAADYVRAYALYNYGGIYLDSDVEVLKPFDPLLDMPYFIGYEYPGVHIEAACMGAEKHHPIFRKILDYYDGRHFVKTDGTLDQLPMPQIILNILQESYRVKPIKHQSEFKESQDTVDILPTEFFSPTTYSKRIVITPNTYSIHHAAGSWASPWGRFKTRIKVLIGPSLTEKILGYKKALKTIFNLKS